MPNNYTYKFSDKKPHHSNENNEHNHKHPHNNEHQHNQHTHTHDSSVPWWAWLFHQK